MTLAYSIPANPTRQGLSNTLWAVAKLRSGAGGSFSACGSLGSASAGGGSHPHTPGGFGSASWGGASPTGSWASAGEAPPHAHAYGAPHSYSYGGVPPPPPPPPPVVRQGVMGIWRTPRGPPRQGRHSGTLGRRADARGCVCGVRSVDHSVFHRLGGRLASQSRSRAAASSPRPERPAEVLPTAVGQAATLSAMRAVT
jgi:hypothetical protein